MPKARESLVSLLVSQNQRDDQEPAPDLQHREREGAHRRPGLQGQLRLPLFAHEVHQHVALRLRLRVPRQGPGSLHAISGGEKSGFNGHFI